MTLTVAQLIEQLQKMDQNLPVVTYNRMDEGFDEAQSPILISSPENEPSSKSDYPKRLFNISFPYILI